MSVQTISLLCIALSFATLMLTETLRPGRRLPSVRGWWLRGLTVSALAFGLTMLFASWFDALLGPHPLIDASSLGVISGAMVGVLFLESLNTLWHIALHRVPLLWRWLHQMHHSTERLDLPSAFYFSPLDTLGWAAVGSFALTGILGLSLPATVLATTSLTVLNLLSHANLRTPHWLGYVISRPEMHARHHARGEHHRNYAVLPVIDMVLGTYDNPPDFPRATGFFDGSSARIPSMLLGRDISGELTSNPARELCAERTLAR